MNDTSCPWFLTVLCGVLLSACVSKPVDSGGEAEASKAAAAQASEPPAVVATHWSYEGPGGPKFWGQIRPEFRLCSEGRNQSPVDLSGSLESNLPRLSLRYRAHKGHEWVQADASALKLSVKSGSVLMVGRHDYALKEVLFHRPSEHKINGLTYPMELQLVHADSMGNLAVMAVMVDVGKANNTVTALWKSPPQANGPSVVLSAPISLAGLIPAKRDYFEYLGSLTTPPCTEGVRWLVFKQPVTLSPEQIQAVMTLLPQGNSRPVQALHGRTVLD